MIKVIKLCCQTSTLECVSSLRYTLNSTGMNSKVMTHFIFISGKSNNCLTIYDTVSKYYSIVHVFLYFFLCKKQGNQNNV